MPYTWDLTHICRSWDEWEASYRELDAEIEAFKSRQGTLASGAQALTDAYRAMDRMGVLSYRVWYYASLRYDEDQRNNDINARRQRVQILFAREHQSSSWFNPELLAIPLETIRQWMQTSPDLALYRFAIEALFHEQEHVLDERYRQVVQAIAREAEHLAAQAVIAAQRLDTLAGDTNQRLDDRRRDVVAMQRRFERGRVSTGPGVKPVSLQHAVIERRVRVPVVRVHLVERAIGGCPICLVSIGLEDRTVLSVAQRDLCAARQRYRRRLHVGGRQRGVTVV
ncbi:MAG TPA: hypothetical protein VFS23_35570 [Vicinamibacterales bacterium]|nr:hypothetical protein [Vicinamibacterales bacterium]